MAMRAGAPRFILQDLRMLLATVGQRIGVSDAVMRRILNHTAPKTDVLHRHYVALAVADIAQPLGSIQAALEAHIHGLIAARQKYFFNRASAPDAFSASRKFEPPQPL